MTLSTAHLNVLIAQAQAGDEPALGELLEGHREFLRLLAERSLGGRLQARLDGSDVVQQTFLSACRNFQGFQGKNAAQFVAWLRKIHERNISDAVRDHAHVAKRAVGREARLGTSSKSLDPPLRTTSPSQRAMRSEKIVQLAQAMGTLTTEQREAIRLRYLEGCSMAEIVDIMDRSRSAVGGLLYRGQEKLKQKLSEIE